MFVSRVECDEFGTKGAIFDEDLDHGMSRRAPALGRAARVEDPRGSLAGELSRVAMCIDHGGAAGEEPQQAGIPTRGSPRIVDRSDLHTLDVHDAPLRKDSREPGLVVVADHAHDRRERF
jgi:hypothetical protein